MGAAQLIDIHGAKGGSDKPKTPTEAPESLRSIALAKMLIAVGEGEFDGTPTAKNIFLDNTPLQDAQGNLNFPNVKWEWRTGSVEQPYIPGIPSVENETSLGIELRSGTPWVRAISNTQLSAAESLMSVIAERDFAQAVRTDRVQAEVGGTSAAVEVVSKAQAEFEGKASAMWSVKMQVNANGQLVTAGIGLGIETNAEGVLQSQFLVSADRFAVVGALAGGEVFTPFVVENGQVFMASAFIQDGTITNAKIGEYIASTNYVAGISGWRLDKSGAFEINGSVPGEGRMIMTHRSLRVYDAANAKRVQLGDLTE